MKKDEFYKYGKILCCVAAGLTVVALVLKKTIRNAEECLEACATSEDEADTN
ncbi:hypothetical protein ACKUSY_02545 [Myroides odoratus]